MRKIRKNYLTMDQITLTVEMYSAHLGIEGKKLQTNVVKGMLTLFLSLERHFQKSEYGVTELITYWL